MKLFRKGYRRCIVSEKPFHNKSVFKMTLNIPARGRQHRSTTRSCKRDIVRPVRSLQRFSDNSSSWVVPKKKRKKCRYKPLIDKTAEKLICYIPWLISKLNFSSSLKSKSPLSVFHFPPRFIYTLFFAKLIKWHFLKSSLYYQ